jgi:glycosyltransferase involved in cell wall biosynthesis
MKICMVEITSFNCVRFRLPLIKKILASQNELTIVSCDSTYKDEIKKIGAKFVLFSGLSSRSINPFHDLKYVHFLDVFFKKNRFDWVMTYTAKPNIYACISAEKNSQKVIATIEGLGDAFTSGTLKWRLLRKILLPLYRKSLRKVNKIYVLNPETKAYFLKHHIGKDKQFEFLNGVGVDTNRFPPSPISNYANVLMVSRLMTKKGILDFCKAAEICSKTRPDLKLHFFLFGKEGDITRQDIAYYVSKSIVSYQGFSEKMSNVYRECGCFVLPSYYGEGLPMSIMEAMSTGRPIITTNWMGCKETVEEGHNGYLVKPKDPHELAEKIMELCSDKQKMDQFGTVSNTLVKQKFSADVITQQICSYLFKEGSK